MPDTIPADLQRYLTPDAPTEARFCRTLSVPDTPEWVGLVDGALCALSTPDAWREFGALSPDEAADAWVAMLQDSWDTPCGEPPPDDLSPYWDEDDGSDLEGTPAEATYDYTDTIEDWIIAAFIASSGQVGAAATFLTIAPRFRLLFKRHDLGGIVKIFIDNELFGTVDTYSPTPDVIAYDVVIS